ncbi:GTP cyclohydrolase I domain protein [Burkholderia pseudomallei]|nr:GTP cyclohydrolase I domain protein [Burkholderia pseudomallei]
MDAAKKLVAGLNVALEFAGVALRDHTLVASPVLAHQQAQLLGLDQARRAARLTMRHERRRDPVRDPLLIRIAMADRVDHARDASEAVQAPARQIRHMGDAAKRQQMMRAHAVHGDAADDHHVLARIVEARAQRLSRIDFVAVEQTPLPELAHTLRSAAGVRAVDLDAARLEQSANRRLECDGIEPARAPDFRMRLIVRAARALVSRLMHLRSL